MTTPCCPAAAAKPVLSNIRGSIKCPAVLDEIFKKMLESGAEPEMVDKENLVKKVSVYNYIPNGLEEEYAEAIMKEYKKYHHKRKK